MRVLPRRPPPQSPCAPCGVWRPPRSSPGSWPSNGSRSATTSPAATPTPCPCATATPCRRGAAAGTTPPSESACPWTATPPTSAWETCRPSARSTSGWRWPTPRARRRAERSPSRRRKTVSGTFFFFPFGFAQEEENNDDWSSFFWQLWLQKWKTTSSLFLGSDNNCTLLYTNGCLLPAWKTHKYWLTKWAGSA